MPARTPGEKALSHALNGSSRQHTHLALALLLTGDSFRDSQWQHEVQSCGPAAMVMQQRTVSSHVQKLVQPLEAAAYQVHVIGLTYPCTNGRNETAALADMYRHGNPTRRVSITVTSRNNSLRYGHSISSAVQQLRSQRRVLNRAVSTVPNLKHVIFMRWDLAIVSTMPLRCLLDGEPVARNHGHVMGYTLVTGMGKVNFDWMLVVPYSHIHPLQHMMREDPESCCSSELCGLACSQCADHLNERVAARTKSALRLAPLPPRCAVSRPLLKKLAPGGPAGHVKCHPDHIAVRMGRRRHAVSTNPGPSPN